MKKKDPLTKANAPMSFGSRCLINSINTNKSDMIMIFIKMLIPMGGILIVY
jgi:hypothetical protein